MDLSLYKNELTEINKIVKSYNDNPLKKTLLLANYSKSKLPNLNNIPQYHNILGLINLRLNDIKKSILDFETAIKINPKFHPAYYNLGLAYFNSNNLDLSYSFLIKAINLKKDYKMAADKLIELLSFYEPVKTSANLIYDLNKKIKKVKFNIDLSNKISDQKIIDYFSRCKKIALENLEDLSYNKLQIFRKKTIFLNCERHKSIFKKYNTIPKYCFDCFKVVIESKSFYDLLKVSLLFDQVTFFSNFNRKNMIDKKSKKDVFKSIIYCSNLEQVFETEKKTKEILNRYFDNNLLITSKRGCYEYELKFPEYKKINKNHSKLMSFPEKWTDNEKEYDLENTKDGFEKKISVHNTIKGNSLHNFLIINNWFNDQKLPL